MADHQHESQAAPGAPRTGFAGPRLQLPRFQLGVERPASRVEAPAPRTAPREMPAPPSFGGGTLAAPAPRAAAQPAAAPAPYAPRPMFAATVRAQPQPQAPQYQPAPAHPQHAPMTNVAPAHLAPAQAAPIAYAAQPHAVPPTPSQPPLPQAPRLSAAASATLRAQSTTISWDRLEAPAPATGVLAKVRPIHMGVLMIFVVVVMIFMSGPTAMKVPDPAASVSGGGTVTGSGTYVPPKAGDTATAAATTANAADAAAATAAAPKAAVAAPKVKGPAMLNVGSAEVSSAIRHGGMPSPAAAANLSIAGGGRVSAADTGAVQLAGMPSPAAAERLGPEVLPYQPSDDVTLPRASNERDSHAVDTHYGDSTLPLEAPIETPVMTPGESAQVAQQQAAIQDLQVDAYGLPSSRNPGSAF